MVTSEDLVNGMVTTLNGEDITIKTTPPRVNGEKILVDEYVDVDATNGVIHGIESVLIPASLNSSIVDIVGGDDRFSTLVNAAAKAGVVDVLGGDGPFTLFGERLNP